jgi:hypothetical protein
MKAERQIADARTLHGGIATTEDKPDQSLKTERETSHLELAPSNSLDDTTGDSSFQQRLKAADTQGITLREFEKRLA